MNQKDRTETVSYTHLDGTPFTSEIAGIDVPVWEEKAGKA